MIKLLEHFKRMQEMASRYLDPEPYARTYPNPSPKPAETVSLSTDFFISDMLYMLDGPEQRESQAQAEHAWGDLKLQSNLFDDAAIMIRKLMLDLRIDGKLIFLEESDNGPARTISAKKLLKALDDCDLIPTMDAFLRACRASHWRAAQLRANGIEPITIPPDAPQYAPEDYNFGVGHKAPTPKAALAFAAMQKFCDRVDAGEVRSTRTYAEFKAILGLPKAPS
jgi:hypothetical protein